MFGGIWFLIAVIVVVLVLLFKLRELRHHIVLVLVVVVLFFFAITFASIYNQNKVDLTTFEGMSTITQVYFGWLSTVGENLLEVGGYAVKQEWGFNETIRP
jgi:TRAP-type uncharacterized transport system fused permease subunit